MPNKIFEFKFSRFFRREEQQLIDRIKELEEELKISNSLLLQPESLTWKPGEVDASVKGPILKFFAGMIHAFFVEEKGENFVITGINHVDPETSDLSRYDITIQKIKYQGKTPAEVMTELRQQVEELRAERDKLLRVIAANNLTITR